MIQKFLKHKKKILIVIIFISLLFAMLSSLGEIEYVFAQAASQPSIELPEGFTKGVANAVTKAFSAPFVFALKIILDILVWFIGQISTLVIALLFVVAEYNHFINEDIVVRGWVVVRDICNMFFVLLLLIIAFSTILRIPNYEVKKTLPKLLIMAVLINFSKTICGLIIDFGQVIMLTFISPFASNTSFSLGHAGVVQAFHLDKMFNISNTIGSTFEYFSPDVSITATVATMLFGFILIVVATVVIATFALMLLYRVIVLWILIILSPLAYLAAAFPSFSKYSSQWWSEFIKNVVVGPVLAFFLWLALSISTANEGNLSSNYIKLEDGATSSARSALDNEFLMQTSTSTQPSFSATLSPLGDVNQLLSFLMTAAFLIGGMMAAQQIGGAAGSVAGKGLGALQAGKGLAFKGARAISGLAGKGAKNLGGWGLDAVSDKLKIDLNVPRAYKRMTAQMDENKRSREQKVYGKAVEGADEGGFLRSKLALASTGDVGWQNLTQWYKPGVAARFVMGGKQANKYRRDKESKENERKATISEDEMAEKKEENKKRGIHLVDLNKSIGDREVEIKNNEGEKKIKLKAEQEVRTGERDLLRDEIDREAKDIEDPTVKIGDKKVKVEVKSNGEVAKLDEEIKSLDENVKKYSLKGAAVAKSANDAELEGQESKKISHIDNADQLGEILKEAISEGNQGLIAAASKKMTKVGDYNEMTGQLGLGTGREAMLGLANLFQKQGKMTEQSALGLVAEIGGIAKHINHFGAFGAVGMKNGKWVESDDDTYEAMQLAEMLKIEPQTFFRNTNRLGLGYYQNEEDGNKQTTDNWHMSRATAAYMKLNSDALVKQIGRAQQNALEHIASEMEVLENNKISKTVINAIKERTTIGQGKGADVFETIKAIRK